MGLECMSPGLSPDVFPRVLLTHNLPLPRSSLLRRTHSCALYSCFLLRWAKTRARARLLAGVSRPRAPRAPSMPSWALSSPPAPASGPFPEATAGASSRTGWARDEPGRRGKPTGAAKALRGPRLSPLAPSPVWKLLRFCSCVLLSSPEEDERGQRSQVIPEGQHLSLSGPTGRPSPWSPRGLLLPTCRHCLSEEDGVGHQDEQQRQVRGDVVGDGVLQAPLTPAGGKPSFPGDACGPAPSRAHEQQGPARISRLRRKHGPGSDLRPVNLQRVAEAQGRGSSICLVRGKPSKAAPGGASTVPLGSGKERKRHWDGGSPHGLCSRGKNRTALRQGHCMSWSGFERVRCTVPGSPGRHRGEAQVPSLSNRDTRLHASVGSGPHG